MDCIFGANCVILQLFFVVLKQFVLNMLVFF